MRWAQFPGRPTFSSNAPAHHHRALTTGSRTSATLSPCLALLAVTRARGSVAQLRCPAPRIRLTAGWDRNASSFPFPTPDREKRGRSSAGDLGQRRRQDSRPWTP
jgi:hypothetical protein